MLTDYGKIKKRGKNMEHVDYVKVSNKLLNYIIEKQGLESALKTIIDLLEEELSTIELFAMGFDYDMILKIKGDQE
jgi:hypothetical protein